MVLFLSIIPLRFFISHLNLEFPNCVIGIQPELDAEELVISTHFYYIEKLIIFEKNFVKLWWTQGY